MRLAPIRRREAEEERLEGVFAPVSLPDRRPNVPHQVTDSDAEVTLHGGTVIDRGEDDGSVLHARERIGDRDLWSGAQIRSVSLKSVER